jgi:hypothetical protein
MELPLLLLHSSNQCSSPHKQKLGSQRQQHSRVAEVGLRLLLMNNVYSYAGFNSWPVSWLLLCSCWLSKARHAVQVLSDL